MSAIGSNIKKYRELKGLTQKEVADYVGKSKNVISNWENGINKPDADTVELLMSILGVDANTLLGWDEKNNIEIDAAELVNEIISNTKIQKMLLSLAKMPDSDIDLVISFIERLNK